MLIKKTAEDIRTQSLWRPSEKDAVNSSGMERSIRFTNDTELYGEGWKLVQGKTIEDVKANFFPNF